MKPTISAQEHYDRLAEAGHGRQDSPVMQEYMARWDGPLFYEALGDLCGKDVLEIGVGCGRVAQNVLKQDCRTLTGLDISPKTIEMAKSELADFRNLELVLSDISEFCRPVSFDVGYSVLTFMHVVDKPKALQNVVDSLRAGGYLILSVDHASDILDLGGWNVALHPWSPEKYEDTLRDMGCEMDKLVPLVDMWCGPDGKKSETYGQTIATLVKAQKT